MCEFSDNWSKKHPEKNIFQSIPYALNCFGIKLAIDNIPICIHIFSTYFENFLSLAKYDFRKFLKQSIFMTTGV